MTGAELTNFDLGVPATVVVDSESNGPKTLTTPDGVTGLRSIEDMEELAPILVNDFNIVSIYTLHVALYALQNPTPENIRRALYKIGISGDCEEHIDWDSLFPLPVPVPSQWDEYLPPPARVSSEEPA